MTPSDYDDVPYQIRQALQQQQQQQQQQSPAFSIVTDGSPQTQVMTRPNAEAHAESAIDQGFHLQFATAASLPSGLRLQQMLQVQAPEEFLHMLRSDRTNALSALSSSEDVQRRLDDLSSDMQFRTERLAACVSSIIGEADATRQHLGAMGQSMQDTETLWKRADGQFKELMTRMDQLEAAVKYESRSQATFEADMSTKMNMLAQAVKDLQAEWARVDASERAHTERAKAMSQEVAGVHARLDEAGHVALTTDQRERLDALCQADVLTKSDGAQILQQMQDVRRDLDKTMEHLESHVHATADRDVRLDGALKGLEITTKLQRRCGELETKMAELMKHLGDDKAAQQFVPSRKTEQAQSPLIEHSGPVHHIIGTPGARHEADAADAADEWWDAHDDKPISSWTQPPGLSFAPTQPPPPIPSSLRQPQGSPKSNQAASDKVSHAAFKLLKDCPKLDIQKGECWEIGMKVNQWKAETTTVLSAIHRDFGTYFEQVFAQAAERYKQRQVTACEPPIPDVPKGMGDCEVRLSLTLLKVLPVKVRQPVLERQDGPVVRSVLLLESLHETVAPGGREEITSLQKFLRSLPPAASGRGILTTLRRWQLATARAASLELPPQAPNEALSAIESLVKTVEKGNAQFSMKLNLLRLQQDVIVTTKSGLDRFILCVEQEARRLSADEDVRTAAGHGNKQQHDDEYVIAKASGKGSDKRPCWFHSTPEGCSRGRDCPFSHDGPSGAAGSKGSKGKGKGKKGKDHDQSADAAAKAKAEAKAKAKAAAKEAKAKIKAEAKTAADAKAKAAPTASAAKSAAVGTPDIPCLAGASQGSESHARACMMRVESRGGSDEPLSSPCDSLWMLRLGQDEMEQYCQTLSVPNAVCWERLHPDTESQALEWQAWECFRDGFTHGELISLTSTGQRLHVASYVRAVSCDSDVARLLLESATASWWCVIRAQHCEPDPVPVGIAFQFADDHAVVRGVATEEEISPEESNLEELGGNSEEEPLIGQEPDPLLSMLDMIDATRYARILREFGVETIADLDLLREDDLADIPAVPRRKILEASQAINRGYISLEDLPDIWVWAHRRNQEVEHAPSEGEPDAEPFGAKLECRDEGHAQALRAQGSEPWVLVDSGANETIRPWLSTMSTAGCKQTSVTTASGDRVEALRSRDGELCIRSSDDSQEWLLSVHRLVQAGGMFSWDESGALLRYWDEERKQYMKVVCQVINGLPYITWTDFKPIRILLSRRYKGKDTTAASAKEAPADVTSQQKRMCDTCTPDEFAELTWAEEDVTVNKSQSELDDVERSEAKAKEMLSSEQITRENVWSLVRDAGLKGQRTRTSLQAEGGTRPRMWMLGYFAHGGVDGITALSRERPYLTRVLCELVRRESFLITRSQAWCSPLTQPSSLTVTLSTILKQKWV